MSALIAFWVKDHRKVWGGEAGRGGKRSQKSEWVVGTPKFTYQLLWMLCIIEKNNKSSPHAKMQLKYNMCLCATSFLPVIHFTVRSLVHSQGKQVRNITRPLLTKKKIIGYHQENKLCKRAEMVRQKGHDVQCLRDLCCVNSYTLSSMGDYKGSQWIRSMYQLALLQLEFNHCQNMFIEHLCTFRDQSLCCLLQNWLKVSEN